MSVTIRGQFQRSVHLVRDVYGSRGLDGYVVTSKARETLGRLADALGEAGAPGAWSISGPYGGGKSAFALFATRLLRGDADALTHLAAADDALAERLGASLPGAMCPVLVVGQRGPVVTGLAEGLGRALDAWADSVPPGNGSANTAARQARALAGQARLATTDAEVLEAVDQAAAVIHDRTGGGLFVVLDELGKHLEYAALHPADGDPFVLQSLAERTARPGAPPVRVVTILHQAIERYAVGLSTEQRDAWRKIQGRFEEVAYVEPVGETLRLLAAAIDADLAEGDRQRGERTVGAVLDAATLAPGLDRDAVAGRLAAALPLHPAVALLVGPLFRRLAQNERSLFSFLASGEPRSFLDVSAGGATYRLDHLYDYLTATLGGALYRDGTGRLWAEAEAALARVAGDDAQERMLKQTAVLSFAGALAGLPPSEPVLLASSGASASRTRAALGALREGRAVTYRPHRDEYRVWEGSDFDAAAALREARAKIPLQTSLAELLTRAAPPRPVVARRHAFETGTTRVFAVAYADESRWRAAAQTEHATDGLLLYVLPEHDAAPLAAEIAGAELDPMTVACVPDGLTGLRDLARDAAALDWVRANTPALDGDAAARREIDAQRADVRATLDHRLAAALAPTAGVWVEGRSARRLDDDQATQPMLSAVCDHVFPDTPRIQSELLNRQNPSASAVRALKLLLQAMAEHPGEPRLGIAGTPAEVALYVSVLQATGLHQETEPGRWRWASPDDPDVEPGTAAAVAALDRAVRQSRAAPVGVPALYDVLRAAPFGVREGLLPVLLTAVLLRLGDQVAVFEDGVYQWSLSYEAVERLLRGPAAFSVQSVGASPAQRLALGALGPRVGLDAAPAPLAVVGRVLQSVAGLPAYVRRTAGLSDATTAVREALVGATEPASLLFRDLPAALGLLPFGDEPADSEPAAGALRQRAEVFASALADALRDLGTAYDRLLSDLDAELAAAFDLRGGSAGARRDDLAQRARALTSHAAEPSLRSFVVRAADDLADTRAWTESLAALLARTPPAQWSDADRQRWTGALSETATRFRRREAVSFGAADAARDTTRFRLSVTATHEHERETVIEIHPEDEDAVAAVEARLRAALAVGAESLDTHLAALSRLSLDRLRQRAEPAPAGERSAPDASP